MIDRKPVISLAKRKIRIFFFMGSIHVSHENPSLLHQPGFSFPTFQLLLLIRHTSSSLEMAGFT